MPMFEGRIVGTLGALEVLFHEAGHAVVGHTVGISPTGGVDILLDGGITHFRPFTSSDNPGSVVTATLAGHAAFNRACSGVADPISLDDARLVALLDEARAVIAAPDTPPMADAADELIALLWIAECAPAASDSAIIAMYREGEAEAARIVGLPDTWRAIEAVAQALGSTSKLSGEEVMKLIEAVKE